MYRSRGLEVNAGKSKVGEAPRMEKSRCEGCVVGRKGWGGGTTVTVWGHGKGKDVGLVRLKTGV